MHYYDAGVYEGISGTDDGYVRHVEGAAKMLKLLGPERCRDGLVNELFFTARLNMVSLLQLPCDLGLCE